MRLIGKLSKNKHRVARLLPCDRPTLPCHCNGLAASCNKIWPTVCVDYMFVELTGCSAIYRYNPTRLRCLYPKCSIYADYVFCKNKVLILFLSTVFLRCV